MANLIQLEAYTGEGGTHQEVWINPDRIISMIPISKGTRIYFTDPVYVVANARRMKKWIEVRQIPRSIRDKVVAERSTRILKR